MATWVHVVVVDGGAGAVHRARRRIDELECRWSRFLPDSEVSRLNAGPQRRPRAAVVSADTALLVRRALDGWRLTAGAFDPTVLLALVAAGYDRRFERIGRTGAPPPRAPHFRPWAEVDLDLNLVTLASGTTFDPGAIGKGLAADLVVAELMSAGAAGACVNLGGDLRAEGEAPGGPPWVVDVEDPFRGGVLRRVGVDAGAVATSSRLRRAWDTDEGPSHHVIDPAPGKPSASDAVAVTVLARQAWWAETLATAAMVMGVAEGLDLLADRGATGLVVDDQGRVHHAAGLDRYLG